MTVRKPVDGQTPLTTTSSVTTTDTIDLRKTKAFHVALVNPGAAVTVYAPTFTNGSNDIPADLANLNTVTGIAWKPVNAFGPGGDWKAATPPFVDAEWNSCPVTAFPLEIIRIVTTSGTTGSVLAGSAK